MEKEEEKMEKEEEIMEREEEKLVGGGRAGRGRKQWDDGFESLVATKNTPPLKITSSSFPLFLAIQHRSFGKYTSQPESNMDLSDQIDRLMSNTRCTAVTLPASLSQFICLISRCCISAPSNGLVSLDLRGLSPWPCLSGHT